MVRKLSVQELTTVLNTDEIRNEYEQYMCTISETGYAIYWKGKRIKFRDSKYTTYTSIIACRKACVYNTSITILAQRILAKLLLGIDCTSLPSTFLIDQHPEYRKMFRYDLRYKPTYWPDSEIVKMYTYIPTSELSISDAQIREKTTNEELIFDLHLQKAKGCLITEWLRTGILEFRKLN